ncbi:MAG: DUF1778 domain-containing protein [Geminicoccaceae bacterium]
MPRAPRLYALRAHRMPICDVITMKTHMAGTRTADRGRQTESAPLDRRYFTLDAETFERLIAMLDAPPAARSRLRRLLAEKAPWEP